MSAPDAPADLGADLSGVGWLDGWSALSRAERHADLAAALTQPATRRARKPRKPALADVLREAARAGRQVRGASVYVDRVEVTFGEPSAEIETPEQLRRLI